MLLARDRGLLHRQQGFRGVKTGPPWNWSFVERRVQTTECAARVFAWNGGFVKGRSLLRWWIASDRGSSRDGHVHAWRWTLRWGLFLFGNSHIHRWRRVLRRLRFPLGYAPGIQVVATIAVHVCCVSLPPGDPSVKYGNPRSLPMVEIAKNVSLFCDLSALPPTARVYRGKVRTAAGGLQEILQRCLGVMLR